MSPDANTIPLKVKAEHGDTVRLYIETPEYVYDISLSVNDEGIVTENGHGHLFIANETDADLKIAVDNAIKDVDDES